MWKSLVTEQDRQNEECSRFARRYQVIVDDRTMTIIDRRGDSLQRFSEYCVRRFGAGRVQAITEITPK